MIEGKERGKKQNRIQWGSREKMEHKIFFFYKSTLVRKKCDTSSRSLSFFPLNTAEYVAAVRGFCLIVCLLAVLLDSCTTTLTYYTVITINLTLLCFSDPMDFKPTRCPLLSCWILSITICVIMRNNRHSARHHAATWLLSKWWMNPLERYRGCRWKFTEAVHRAPSLWKWVLPFLLCLLIYSNKPLSSSCLKFISFQLWKFF